MLTGGQLAALIVAVFWAILVSFLSYALVRLAGVLSEATTLVSGVADRTTALLDEMTTTVNHVDGQVERMDAITRDVESVAGNASKLSALCTTVFGGPIVRTASLSHGLRKAVEDHRQGDLRRLVRAERRAARRRGHLEVWS